MARAITLERPLVIREAEYHRLVEEDSGKCLACGAEPDGFCEPDAEGYKCQACGELQVMGAEQMLVEGYIQFTTTAVRGERLTRWKVP